MSPAPPLPPPAGPAPPPTPRRRRPPARSCSSAAGAAPPPKVSRCPGAMGFDPARFAAPVAAELQCKLCGRVLEEPLSTPCGHVFCAGCLLPWAARRRRCPLRCRPLAAAELRPVLPLRSLVQKLEVRCDYSPRGCGRVVRLRELPAHLAACRYGPPRDALPAGRAEGGGQRCPRERRGGGGQEPGPELKREALRWSRREKSLLAQLSALQSEVQLTALRYQAKFGQYMSHISSITRDLTGSQRGKVSADHRRLLPGGAAPPGARPAAGRSVSEMSVPTVTPATRSPPSLRRDTGRVLPLHTGSAISSLAPSGPRLSSAPSVAGARERC